MSTGEIVGGIFFARDQLLGMEKLSVGASADLVDDRRLKIEENRAGNVFAGTGLREEGVEGIITATDGLVRGHLAIRLDTMFETEELPTGVTDLNTGLTDVDAECFAHDESWGVFSVLLIKQSVFNCLEFDSQREIKKFESVNQTYGIEIKSQNVL